MTRDDIIRMAREAGWRESFTPPVAIYRFAALVEQHLIQQGYRQCAQGQRTTQHCGLLEAVKADALNAWAADRLARHGIPMPDDENPSF